MLNQKKREKMSELHMAGKIQAFTDKERKLYEIMFRLGIIKEDVEKTISSASKRLEFPKGYYRTLVYQLSCLLSEDEINTLSGSSAKELFFNNLGLVLAGGKYNMQDGEFSQIGTEFLKEYRECLESYESSIEFMDMFRKSAKKILFNITNKRTLLSWK